MKHKQLLCAAAFIAACTFSINVCAQLEVLTSGDVKISKTLAVGTENSDYIGLNLVHTAVENGTNQNYGIKSTINTPNTYHTASTYGLYGYAKASTSTSQNSSFPLVGVCGVSMRNNNLTTSFTAGVAGLAQTYGGIGVYGGVGYIPYSMIANENYAGYFNGTVKVNGTLVATAVSTTSDERLKENIKDINRNVVDHIAMLHPVSYTIKPDTSCQYDEKSLKEMQQNHYGLIAQEVQNVMPEIVYERDGYMSINYIELIPLLIQKVQELSAEMKALKNTPKAKTPTSFNDSDDLTPVQAVLFQNKPNPFSVGTKIDYQLPLSTQTATLYIYDMNGLQIEEYPISLFGQGSVTVSGGTLKAGMYLYSLIADGQVIDTKRMILTK